jgi:hypothetical protein
MIRSAQKAAAMIVDFFGHFDCTASSSERSRCKPCCRRPTPPPCCSGLAMLSEAQRQYSNESNEEQQGYDQDGLHIIAVGSHCSVAAM